MFKGRVGSVAFSPGNKMPLKQPGLCENLAKSPDQDLNPPTPCRKTGKTLETIGAASLY